MADIQFETNPDEFGKRQEAPAPRFDAVQWLIQKGIVADATQAQYALLGFVVLVIVVAYIVLRSGGGSAGTTQISRESMDAVMQRTLQQQQAPSQYGN